MQLIINIMEARGGVELVITTGSGVVVGYEGHSGRSRIIYGSLGNVSDFRVGGSCGFEKKEQDKDMRFQTYIGYAKEQPRLWPMLTQL